MKCLSIKARLEQQVKKYHQFLSYLSIKAQLEQKVKKQLLMKFQNTKAASMRQKQLSMKFQNTKVEPMQ